MKVPATFAACLFASAGVAALLSGCTKQEDPAPAAATPPPVASAPQAGATPDAAKAVDDAAAKRDLGFK